MKPPFGTGSKTILCVLGLVLCAGFSALMSVAQQAAPVAVQVATTPPPIRAPMRN